MRKLLLALTALLVLLSLPVTALADESYVIKNYDVHVTVGENNVLDVKETITVDFSERRHGIYHEVQIAGEYENQPYTQRVYDYSVKDTPFELSRDGDYLMAKIGDPDIYVSGEQVYEISYKCVVNDPSHDEFDKFYRNIINCAYGDTIENASFAIELPKDFDESEVNVLLGSYGSEDTSGVEWKREGNTIKGHTLRPVTGGEIVTVRMKFPQGYFTGEPADPWDIVLYVISGLLVLVSLVLWILYGRDDRIFPTVEFYPPEGMTPAEAGYVIDGCVDDKDVVSLILYWADKGYIRIDEKEKKEFELVKLKELHNPRRYERIMFDRLFDNGDAVAISSLKYSFYTTMSSTKAFIGDHFENSPERRLFTKESKRARTFMALATMMPIALSLFRYIYRDAYDMTSALIGAAVVSMLISLPILMLVRLADKWRGMQKGARTAGLITSLILLGLAFFGYIVAVPLVFGDVSWAVIAVTAGATLIMTVLTLVMKKRTKQGGEWLAKLIGFKEFIEKAEKDRIVTLVEQNPSYFYNVLPYAYVLGVTDKWAKNFEGIGVEPPDWYRGYYGSPVFNAWLFTNMMTHNLSRFQSDMVSRPASSSGGFGGGSGGGFSGGGFSGGGFGGGGVGGSW